MRKIIKELAGWLVYIVIVVIIAWGFVTFVAQRTQVSGSSMETTLSDGDQLIVDKISYQFREPERFEIIVFPYQYEAGTYYIKRIIGLPGDATDYSLDDRYRLRELNYTQNGKTWHVTYGGYTSDTQPALPSNVELNNGAQRIKLKMDNWIVK